MNDVTTPLRQDYPKKPKPSKLGHVVLRTNNFEGMKRFYASLLCASPTFENAQACFMTYDDEHHRIGLIHMPHLTAIDPKSAGLEHISFTYSDLPSLLAAYAYNKEEGITPYWTINHGPTVSLYYRDPDGNAVELQHDVFHDQAGVDAFFGSGAYEENFMGIIFDPDKMLSDYIAGTPIEELTKRPKLPEGMTPWDMHRS